MPGNSLPAFTLFQKRFCRPPGAAPSTELWGYNHQTLAWLTGPGYFVVHDSARGAGIDYREVPSEHPDGWPEIHGNDRGIARQGHDRCAADCCLSGRPGPPKPTLCGVDDPTLESDPAH